MLSCIGGVSPGGVRHYFSDLTEKSVGRLSKELGGETKESKFDLLIIFYGDIFGHSPESQGVFANCLQAEPRDNRVEE
jgi:hypothetical protein